jgi:phosphoribosylformimino-5-aminoimidazole carboxamide ribotide isomerase
MRVIPVLDLKDGLVVHGVKGERQYYKPVVSVLTHRAEPMAVARAFSEKLGLHELYVADLNAIQGHGHHQAVIAELGQEQRIRLWVDAGITGVSDALRLLEIGVSKVIIGAETLDSWNVLKIICTTIPISNLVFSLDMQAGQVLSRSSQLAALGPLQVLERVQQMGLQEVILLDLARVGSGAGLDRELIAESRRRYPDLALFAGGGIRDAQDLRDLEAMGVAGALVATALHQGMITASTLREFEFGIGNEFSDHHGHHP